MLSALARAVSAPWHARALSCTCTASARVAQYATSVRPPLRDKSSRFYKTVQVVETEGGYCVLLDSHIVRTPGQRDLVVPSHVLALALAAEWEWQTGARPQQVSMPLMSLAATVLDQPKPRSLVEATLLRHVPTDAAVVRYPPGALADRQAQVFDPLLRWAEEELGWQQHPYDSLLAPDTHGHDPSVTNPNATQRQHGAAALPQLLQPSPVAHDSQAGVSARPGGRTNTPVEVAAVGGGEGGVVASAAAGGRSGAQAGVVAAAARFLRTLSLWHLAGVEQLAASCRSLTVAAAVYHHQLSAADALAIARLEEDFQAEEWGEVEAGHDLDRADTLTRITAATCFVRLTPVGSAAL